MSQPSVLLADAGKRYVKYEDTPTLFGSTLRRFRNRTRRSELWAVRHVDFEIDDGDCVGVIGRNGSGKSTMLQMLAGVTAPTEGLVAVRGRVAPLISVGVGFHPELTGRENVYVNGTILGLSRQMIDRKLEEIIEFAEIRPFIDTPVKFYSSGMVVRLGFAVAVQAEPDVLLIDEVLAVGDIAFQWKCFDRMTEIRQSGTTIALVSHNLNAVRKLCQRTMVLNRGQVVFNGPTPDAISLFHELMDEHREMEDFGDDGPRSERKDGVVLESFRLLGPDGEQTGYIQSGDEVTFRVEARLETDVIDPIFSFGIVNEKGTVVYSESTMGRATGNFHAGQCVAYDVRVPLRLGRGSYQAKVGVSDRDLRTQLGKSKPLAFFVATSRVFSGIVDLAADLSITPIEAPVDGPTDDADLAPLDDTFAEGPRTPEPETTCSS